MAISDPAGGLKYYLPVPFFPLVAWLAAQFFSITEASTSTAERMFGHEVDDSATPLLTLPAWVAHTAVLAASDDAAVSPDMARVPKASAAED